MPTIITGVGSPAGLQGYESTIIHNGFAGPTAPPAAPSIAPLFVACPDDGALVMIDTVVYPDAAALVPVVPSATPVVNFGANSSPIIIDNTVLYQAKASFVPVTTPATTPLPGQATASSSPVIIENTVLYQAIASFVRTPEARTESTLWFTQFPIPAPLAAILASWAPETDALAPPSTFVETLQTFDQWPIPAALRTNTASLLPPGAVTPQSTATVAYQTFEQWPIPAALGGNAVSLLPGFGAVTYPFTINVLPPNVANWYLQYPIPPAKGAINVAALIDGFTWSEASTGGVIQSHAEWIIRARRRGRR